MNKFFAKATTYVSAFLLASGLAATNSAFSESDITTQKIDYSKVNLRVGAASFENAYGLLEAAGNADTAYKVDFRILQGGNLVLEAIAANQLDLGTGSQIPPISASQASNGGNFKIIAVRETHILDQELIVGRNTSIKDVKELKGKKVGYVKNTTAHYFLKKILEQHGLEWSDIDAIALTTADGLTAILTGEIDALASYGNAIVSAKLRGAKTLQTAEGILSGDFYWEATPDAIKDPSYHAAIVDFLKRYNDAAEWARQNPEAYSKYVAKSTGQEYQIVYDQFIAGTKQRPVRVVPISQRTIDSEQDIINTFHSLGVLKEKIDANILYDRSFDKEVGTFKRY